MDEQATLKGGMWGGGIPSRLHPFPRSCAGLTLIEVMLALAILGIGLTVLIDTASRCLAVVRQARAFETARHLMARVEVENPLQLEEEIEEGKESGDFKGGPRGYTWDREIKVVGEEEDGLFEVRTRVVWSNKGNHPSEEITTYLYSPPKGGTVISPP